MLDATLGAWQCSRIVHHEAPPSVEDFFEKRKAARLRRMMAIREPLKRAWYDCTDGTLRAGFARRYRELVGVPVERADAVDAALDTLQPGATVDDIVSAYGDG